jgi:hypothetical protein
MPTPHEEHAFKMHAFSLSSPIFSLTGWHVTEANVGLFFSIRFSFTFKHNLRRTGSLKNNNGCLFIMPILPRKLSMVWAIYYNNLHHVSVLSFIAVLMWVAVILTNS